MKKVEKKKLQTIEEMIGEIGEVISDASLRHAAAERMAEKGFETHRLTKPEIKRFLAIYLEASMDGDKMPDVDGGQYVKEVRKDG